MSPVPQLQTTERSGRRYTHAHDEGCQGSTVRKHSRLCLPQPLLALLALFVARGAPLQVVCVCRGSSCLGCFCSWLLLFAGCKALLAGLLLGRKPIPTVRLGCCKLRLASLQCPSALDLSVLVEMSMSHT
jgi:hypothetical protein